MARTGRTLHGDEARRRQHERLQLKALVEAQGLALALGSTRKAAVYMAAVGAVEMLDAVDMNQWHGHPLQADLGAAIREAERLLREAAGMIEDYINEEAP